MPDKIIDRMREARVTVAEATAGKRSVAIGSTEAPVITEANVDGTCMAVREVLVHEAGAIDTSAMRAVVLQHRAEMIVGPITDHRINEARELEIGFSIYESAKLPTEVSVREALDSGALDGVSLRYRYSMSDTDYDRSSNTLYVRKWRAMELTLTAIPEDTDSRVVSRSAGDHHGAIMIETKEATVPDKTQPAGHAAPANQEGERSAPAPVTPVVDTVDHAREAQEIAAQAESLGLKASEFVGMRSADASKKMLAAVAEKMRSALPDVKSAPGTQTEIVIDQADKARAVADEYFRCRAMRVAPKGDNPLLGRWRLRDAARSYARMVGLRGADDWDDNDAARFALGDYRNMSDRSRAAANITNASFPSFVTASIVTKIVAEGFSQTDDAITYPLWTRTREVPNFQQYTYGNLGTGNLEITDENVAFPELLKSEGHYNSKVLKWGGTLSLTLEALVNDDTGLFFESLQMAGAIARKTKERRCYERLLATAQWTNNTTAGNIAHTTADTSYAARALLDGVIAGMLTKTGLDKNPLNNPPRFLLAPTALAGQAEAIAGGVAPGQQTNQGVRRRSLQVIESAWLSAATLTGASATSYYLIADPASVRGMTEVLLSPYPGIVVEEYDAGAVAARNWKMWHAFEFDLPKLGTLIAGAHRGTAA